jgi:hypothetical protein
MPNAFQKRGFTNDQAPALRGSSCDQMNSKQNKNHLFLRFVTFGVLVL